MPQTTTLDHSQYDVPATFKAPKARPIPAWGVAPGTSEPKTRGLKARPIISIPQIPFIEFHPIFREKCTKFILKIVLPMMRLLGVDVTNQGSQIRRPNRKRTISSLPRELRQVQRLGLKPLGGRRLELFHDLRDVRRARQSNCNMNVVCSSAHAKAFAFGVASNGGKIGVKGKTNGRIEEGRTVLCTENYMDQNKRERLRHRIDYRAGFQPSCATGNATWGFTPCWYKGAPLALSSSAIFVSFLLLPSIANSQSPTLHIRVINAQTNKPITNERLNVALKTDQIGSVAMATDKNGIISVDYGNATIIRVLANMYADCRPRSELYTDYPIATILKTGITTGNLCSSAQPKAHPGQLILFEIPKTYIPVFPAPPNGTLPHSDENPHQPQN
jgi:hypothetical protein